MFGVLEGLGGVLGVGLLGGGGVAGEGVAVVLFGDDVEALVAVRTSTLVIVATDITSTMTNIATIAIDTTITITNTITITSNTIIIIPITIVPIIPPPLPFLPPLAHSAPQPLR